MSTVTSARPIYIWGPQLIFMDALTECGPCELYEITTLAEAFAFSPKIAAHPITNTLPFVRDALGEDLVLTDISERAAEKAGLAEDSVAVRRDNEARLSGPGAVDRVNITLKFLLEGDHLFQNAVEDNAKYFELFHQEGFDVLPRVETAVESLAALNKYRVSQQLLSTLESSVQKNLEVLAGLTRSRIVPVPPMAAILLRRCRSPDDIPAGLKRLRRDFASARKELAKYSQALDAASTLGEQIDALNDIQAARERLAKAVAGSEGLTPTSTIVRHGWDIGKQGSLMKATTTAIDIFIDLLKDRKGRRLSGYFVDIYRQMRDIKSYSTLLTDVFGEKNVDMDLFARFEAVNRRLNALH